VEQQAPQLSPLLSVEAHYSIHLVLSSHLLTGSDQQDVLTLWQPQAPFVSN
jgi:hypothetical protein